MSDDSKTPEIPPVPKLNDHIQHQDPSRDGAAAMPASADGAVKVGSNQGEAFMVVHGIGDQARLEPLRAFVEGCLSGIGRPALLTRAALGTQLGAGGLVPIPGSQLMVTEYNYSGRLDAYVDLAEGSIQRWISSIRDEIDRVHSQRVGTSQRVSLPTLNTVVGDMLLGTRIARIAVDRIKLGDELEPIERAATRLLQQIQLYADLKAYRDEIDEGLRSAMTDMCSNTPPTTRITVAAHSLGTVVALRCILDAVAAGEPWAHRVDRLVTFGSPIDLFVTLYPELFSVPKRKLGKPINWTNYCFGNDPIATDLQVIRRWVRDNADTVFADRSPREVYLGRGAALTSHTGYWTSRDMFSDILHFDDSIATQNTSRSIGRVSPLFVAQQSFSVASGWLLLIWWEENLKASDSDRQSLNGAAAQLACFALAFLLVSCHSRALSLWSVRCRCAALFWAFISVLIAAGLSWLLPTMRFAIESLRHVSANIFIVAGITFSNVIAFLWSGHPLRKTMVGALLSAAAFIMCFILGSRTNPSNVLEEFDTVVPMLLFWWLSVICARLDWVLREVIGGRHHLDALCRLWGIGKDFRESSSPSSGDLR